MGNRVAVLIFVALAAVFARPEPASAFSIVFSDPIFSDPDWSIFAVTYGNGGSSSSTQLTTGGNPDEFRRTSIAVNSAPGAGLRSGVHLVHLFNAATWNPSTQGSLTSVSYSEDAIWLGGPTGSAKRHGVAVRQGGNIYVPGVNGVAVTGVETSWHSEAATWFETDLFRLDPTDLVNGLDEISHPNFATGGMIEWGFVDYAVTGPGGGSIPSLVTGIDNWELTLNGIDSVPEPSTLALTALGSMGWAAWRWRRKR